MKDFNDTGLCIPEMHYMVDTSPKINKVIKLIEKGKYFTMNRPRQFGKTTTASILFKHLSQKEDYLTIRISFEGIGDTMFDNESTFSEGFFKILAKELSFTNPDAAVFFEDKTSSINSFQLLSQTISTFIKEQNKKIVLLIDEVDKSSNNQLFLYFLGMLRDKYLRRNDSVDYSFQSVILIGVHDIKNLKRKITKDFTGSLNSPWNIAVDFKVDMTFHPKEIETMLVDYSNDKGIKMDIPIIAERIYYYTFGYPYLVSKLCKFIDEDILPEKEDTQEWSLNDVEQSFKYLTRPSYQTTLFDDLAKNLINNPELYNLVFDIVMNGKRRSFSLDNPMISLAHTYGILRNDSEICKVHNRVFEQRIYNLMISMLETSANAPLFPDEGFTKDNELLLEKIMLRFQAFMQENYATKDIAFLEREGRLLFLAFLKPIINGQGFDFKEPVVGDEKRMDVVVTYLRQRNVIELKRWKGESYHQAGLQQLSNYLDLYQLKKGFLLIYDFRKEKTYKQEVIQFKDKEIFAVWV